MKIKNKGFTLIELILVMAVIVSVAAASLYIYKKVKLYNAVNSISSEFTSIQSQIKTLKKQFGYNSDDYFNEFLNKNSCYDNNNLNSENYNKSCFESLGIKYDKMSNMNGAEIRFYQNNSSVTTAIYNIMTPQIWWGQVLD